MYLNKFLFTTLVLVMLSACSDKDIDLKTHVSPIATTKARFPGKKRIVFNSRNDLHQALSSLETGTPLSRVLVDYQYSDNELPYVSLLEANIQNIRNSMSPEALALLESDEDVLSICPDDSIIADMHFAQLLNENREIQIGDTIYRYISNGVLYATIDYQEYLDAAQEIASEIAIENHDDEEDEYDLGNNVSFIPVDYGNGGGYDEPTPPDILDGDSIAVDWNYPGTGAVGSTETGYGIRLPDGIFIPSNNVRVVNFASGGDGNFIQQLWTGFFGKSVQAIKNFDSNRKLIVNLYRQNYIIHEKIGVKVRFQKKVVAWWLNVEPEDMAIGWDMIALRFKFPVYVQNYYPDFNGSSYSPSCFENPVSMTNTPELLLYTPKDSLGLNYRSHNLILAYKDRLNKTIRNSPSGILPFIAGYSDLGLFSNDQNYMYVVTNPYVGTFQNRSSKEINVYERWNAMILTMRFNLNSNIVSRSVNFEQAEKAELYRASVFGAVKYRGCWIGARVIKDTDN